MAFRGSYICSCVFSHSGLPRKAPGRDTVTVVLIEKNAFFAEGIKSLLSDTAFEIVRSYGEIDALDAVSGEKCMDAGLVVVGIEGSAAQFGKAVAKLKSQFCASRMAVLTTRDDVACVAAAFSAGADGYILRDISPEAFVGYLNMVMLGEKVCPSLLLGVLVSQAADIDAEPGDRTGHGLSGREVQVLRFLSIGNTCGEFNCLFHFFSLGWLCCAG